MLSLPVAKLPEGPIWSYDGYRALGLKAKGRVRLFSRNGKDFTKRFASITANGWIPLCPFAGKPRLAGAVFQYTRSGEMRCFLDRLPAARGIADDWPSYAGRGSTRSSASGRGPIVRYSCVLVALAAVRQGKLRQMFKSF